MARRLIISSQQAQQPIAPRWPLRQTSKNQTESCSAVLTNTATLISQTDLRAMPNGGPELSGSFGGSRSKATYTVTSLYV